MDFLFHAGEEYVQEIVLEPPAPKRRENGQPDLILLDAARGSVNDEEDAELVPGAVILHVYDLNEGFRKANELLTFSWEAVAVGGAFHVGVEVFGVEWFYGCVGVTSTLPRCASGHVYNSSVLLGVTPLDKLAFAAVLNNMCHEWRGADYQLISHNCVSFASELCGRLGTKPLPSWVSRVPHLLDTGRRVSNDAKDRWRAVQTQMAVLTTTIVQHSQSFSTQESPDRLGPAKLGGPKVLKGQLARHPGDSSNLNDTGEMRPQLDEMAEGAVSISTAPCLSRVGGPVLLGRARVSAPPPATSDAAKLATYPRGRQHSDSFQVDKAVCDGMRTVGVPMCHPWATNGALAEQTRATKPGVKQNGAVHFGQSFKPMVRSASPPPASPLGTFNSIPAWDMPHFARPQPAVSNGLASDSVNGEVTATGDSAKGFKFMARSISPPRMRTTTGETGNFSLARPRLSLPGQPLGTMTSLPGCASPALPNAPPLNPWSWNQVKRQTSTPFSTYPGASCVSPRPSVIRQTSGHGASPSMLSSPRPSLTQGSNHFRWADRDIYAMTP